MHNLNFSFSILWPFFTRRENKVNTKYVLKGLLHYWLILWAIAQNIWHDIVSCLCNSSFHGILLSPQDTFVHLPALLASDLLEIQDAISSTSCHDNFPPAKLSCIAFMQAHILQILFLVNLFHSLSCRGCLERQDYGLGFRTYWYVMQNRNPLTHNAEQQNIWKHDAEQNSLFLNGCGFAVFTRDTNKNKYLLQEEKSIMTPNISRNIWFLQICLPEHKCSSCYMVELQSHVI